MHVAVEFAGGLQGVHEVPHDWVDVLLRHCSAPPLPHAWNVVSHVIPHALLAQSAVALATVVVHAAAAVETKRHEFESTLHVSISVMLVQT